MAATKKSAVKAAPKPDQRIFREGAYVTDATRLFEVTKVRTNAGERTLTLEDVTTFRTYLIRKAAFGDYTYVADRQDLACAVYGD